MKNNINKYKIYGRSKGRKKNNFDLDKKIVSIVLQVNGKKKLLINAPFESSQENILEIIRKNNNIPSSYYENSKKVIFLIIEFHDVNKHLNKIRNFLKNLDLKIIHIHANNYGGIDKKNNPRVLELSLINSKIFKIKNIYSKNKYPIPNLDYKNFKRRDDIKIKFNK